MVGMMVKAQSYQGYNWAWDNSVDDSGFNGIRLACSGGEELISAEGPFGGWSEWKLSSSNRSIVSVNIRSQPPCELYSGYCDNSATNGLRFVDSSGVHYEPWDEYWYIREVEHSFQKWKSVEYKLKGYWSYATCPGGSTNANGLSFPGKVITGFRTKVEPYQGDGDDTGLNMVQFHCGYNV